MALQGSIISKKHPLHTCLSCAYARPRGDAAHQPWPLSSMEDTDLLNTMREAPTYQLSCFFSWFSTILWSRGSGHGWKRVLWKPYRHVPWEKRYPVSGKNCVLTQSTIFPRKGSPWWLWDTRSGVVMVINSNFSPSTTTLGRELHQVLPAENTFELWKNPEGFLFVLICSFYKANALTQTVLNIPLLFGQRRLRFGSCLPQYCFKDLNRFWQRPDFLDPVTMNSSFMPPLYAFMSCWV